MSGRAPTTGCRRRAPLSLDNLTLVRPQLCTSLVTRLGEEVMGRICQALGHATAC
jgi:hypothetical protein